MTNSKNDQEVIVIENPEVINGNTYTGEIISVHVGFVFIHNVKRGYETVGTNGDVFCPVPENHHFQVNQLVQFEELNPDKEKTGRFRTEKIELLQTGIDINTTEGRMYEVARLSREVSPYHQLKKMIEEDDISKARENQPLAEFVQQIAWLLNKNGGYKPEDIVKLTEEFISKNFSMLNPIGVKCSIMNDVDKVAEKATVEETITLYNENGLSGQADSLKKEYGQFLKVRDAFTLMHTNNLLNHSSVIDIKHLPELAFAFPVWYVNAKNEFRDQTNDKEPRIDHVNRFFSDSVGSDEFSWFYQLYNRRTRPMFQFSGRDIMPPNLVRIMKEAKELFDYVVIMTPYHDVASTEWSNPNWLRNIDPIMVGFISGLPHMFVLGRWSGTGVFPLLLDCIADTANHLKLNKHLLKNFNPNSFWYKGANSNEYLGSVDRLTLFADTILKSYDTGLLFPFLRGELREDKDYRFKPL